MTTHEESIKEKTILGLIEDVTLIGPDGKTTVIARIDSGAMKSSIDIQLASDLRLGPIVGSKIIKSANGAKLRPVVETQIEMCGRIVKDKFTMADRRHMRYKVLIGQNILKQGFLIDPSKHDEQERQEKKQKQQQKEDLQ